MNPNSGISLRTAAVGTLLVFAPLLVAKEAYEKPRKLATAEVLPAAVRSGDHFRVKSPVENDGVMNLYAVDSDYGQFEAYGNFALGKLLHEIHAIAELDEVSKSKEFLETAARSATGQLKTIGEFARHPTATVKGMPKGVKRMFHQYEGQAKKGYQTAKDVGGEVGDAIVPGDADDDKGEKGEGDVAEATGKATQAAESYAKKWFGTTAAERRWYKKLEVDPYTRNPVLRHAVSNMAKVDAAAHVGMKFVPIPSIPGVSYLNRMNHAVWDADPEELRKLNIQRLRDAGVDQKQIDRFMNNEHLSPTQQTLLLTSLADMKGVQGLGNVLELSSRADSQELAEFDLTNALLLTEYHRKVAPISEVYSGEPVPVAKTSKDDLLIIVSADYAFWEKELAGVITQMANEFNQRPATTREIWLRGKATPRFVSEVEKLGWGVRQSIELADQVQERFSDPADTGKPKKNGN